jgi:putative oxidoreductase
MRQPLIRLPLTSNARSSGAALLAIRLVMGPMLAWHGVKKIEGGVEQFVGTVDRLGFPLPEVLARGVIAIELVGGICLALGLLTRLWGGLLTAQMLLIVFKVKWDVGLFGPPGRGGGFEIDLMYAVTGTALLLAGPGLAALDHLLGLEEAERDAPSPAGAGTLARSDHRA